MAGTQAENIIDNHIVVSKMFSLCKTQYDDDPEEAEPDDYDQEAKIVYDTIPHHGAVNRIRVGALIVNSTHSAFLTDRRSWACGRTRAS